MTTVRQSLLFELAFNSIDRISEFTPSTSTYSSLLLNVYKHCKLCNHCRLRSRPRREGNRLTFQEVSSWFSDDEFRVSFRMRRESFVELVSKLLPDLVRCTEMGKRSTDGVVEPQVRVGAALRLLAGANVVDLMLLFHIGQTTIYRSLQEVVTAVGNHLKLPGIPTDPKECRRLAEWMKYSRGIANPLHGCMFAVDGIAIRIDKPEDRDMPREFRCRKGFYALPLIAAVDGKYRFLCFSLRCPGATHDSLAYAVSNLRAFLESGRLPKEVWGAGDEAFVCTEVLIVPIPASLVDPNSAEDAFNFFLSSFRVHVEQAFGMLVARWNLLRSGLRYSLRNTFVTVQAMLLLHNFCIERSDYFSEGLKSDPGVVCRNAEWDEWVEVSTQVYDEIESRLDDNRRAHSAVHTTIRREKMVEVLRSGGYRRPTCAE